jgi:signal transduction histidine kinase
MAPNTALGLMFCGIALVLFDAETRRGFVPAQYFILTAGLLALLAVIGHVYHVLLLNRLGSALPMSLDTAIALVFFCLSFLATQPRRGFMAVINSSTVGGTMARRLLPMAVFVPWLLGLLLLLGEQAGYYSRESALSLFAVITIVIFTSLIWWNARLLHLADLERARTDEQLRQTSLNLQRSNTDLEQFAYVASHDLFEPLRMVTSYLQLLRQQYRARLDKQADEFIDFAIDGARRMEALIHDLLAYSRVDISGRSLEPVDCELAFQAALVNLKVAIEESQATVTHSKLPRVLGDRVQLTQVFQNLLGNALKFRGRDPPRVEVVASRRDHEWVFSVKDNGLGIEPKDFNRVFVIFQRLHTRQEYPGTGIGLSLCKKIIERHGGHIWVESTPGQGSTFFFTLPAMAESS